MAKELNDPGAVNLFDPALTTIRLETPCPTCGGGPEPRPDIHCCMCDGNGFLVQRMPLKEFLSHLRAIIPESNTRAQAQQELDIEWSDE